MPIVTVERPAMGSLFQIFLEGDDTDSLARLGEDALDRVGWLEQQFSHFLPESDICRINSLAYKESVPVAPNTLSLLQRCRCWSEETDGAFDCTAGKLVKVWGFFKQGTVQSDGQDFPSADIIAKIVENIGWKFVELNEAHRTVRFHSPEIELHLGAVGKGYIVQTVADYLTTQGVECALLHSGHSSIAAIGAPSDGEGWQIALEEETILLRDRAVSVSSNRETAITIQGKSYGHLFDPRTGQPVDWFGQVAVIADDAADAEALSTAFVVNCREWADRYLQTHPEFSVFWRF